ncbi:hypothetical protein [Thermococcus sp.]
MGVKMIIFAILSVMFLGLISSQTIQQTHESLTKLSEIMQFYSSVPPETTEPYINITQVVNIKEHPSVNIKSGKYNLSEIDDSLKNELLNPADRYIGNTSLSQEYAIKVYNDTLKIVENATATSSSILKKFLTPLFGPDSSIEKLIEEAMRLIHIGSNDE